MSETLLTWHSKEMTSLVHALHLPTVGLVNLTLRADRVRLTASVYVLDRDESDGLDWQYYTLRMTPEVWKALSKLLGIPDSRRVVNLMLSAQPNSLVELSITEEVVVGDLDFEGINLKMERT